MQNSAEEQQSDSQETFSRADSKPINRKESVTKHFAEQVWRHNSRKSLRLILSGEGKQYFRKFLAKEHNVSARVDSFQHWQLDMIRGLQENHVDFYEQVERFKEAKKSSKDLDRSEDGALHEQAKELYNKFIRAGGEQEVNLPGSFKNSSLSNDPLPVLEQAQEEVLRMLSMDCFPRFLQSKECEEMLDSFKNSELHDNVDKSKKNVPNNRDEWLGLFKSVAEHLPTCIVIADRMAAGLPIIFVNQAFTETTLYSKDEAEGRNCRFLQGPETDPESVELIRDAIANNRECHVNILNYRQNGEKFQNLLSLKPVFGPYNDCEYYIGVQYEVTNASMMVTRLLQHEHLLKMLPSNVFYRGVA